MFRQELIAWLFADLDGDSLAEFAAVYRINEKLSLFIFRWVGSSWRAVFQQEGKGYGVSVFFAAPITDRNRNDLVVGWQTGAEWSKLSVYAWTPQGYEDIAPMDLAFSRLEAGPFPGALPSSETVELALWMHDTGEAYKVEVVRWVRDRFVPAYDVYPFYFRRVAEYYERLVRLHPDFRMYWYYLADAQWKAGFREAAFRSVGRALSIEGTYPPQETLLELQRRIAGPFIPIPQPNMGETRGSGLFPASVKAVGGTQWGYIDSSGAWRIRPQFEMAEPFQPSRLAVVGQDGKAGVIDETGEFVIGPVYDSINTFTEGRAVVIDDEGFKVIDERESVLTGKAYPFIANYSDGRALFSQTSGDSYQFRYGYLDLQGNEAIPARYEEAGDFGDGKAIVKVKDQEYAMIGKTGERLATYPYAYVGSPGDRLLPFRKEENGKYGYIDEGGTIVIEPKFTWAMPFEEGRAVVNTAEDYGNRYGLIDREGEFTVKPVYNEIRRMGEGRVALGRAKDPERPYIGSIYAISDLDGRLLTGFRFYDVTEYEGGLASVSDEKHTYFVDRSGRQAPGLPVFEGNGTVTMVTGIIEANIDQRLAYYNRSGRAIWTPNTVIALPSSPIIVREEKYAPKRDYLVYYPQIVGMPSVEAQTDVNRQLRELSQVKDLPAGDLDYSYIGDFSIPFFKNRLLVLELNGYRYPYGAAHGMPSLIYVHIDLNNGRIYRLSDLFKKGSDWVAEISNIIGEQIRTDPQYDYVFQDAYHGISADQPFVVTEDALHIYFQPYEIAPYAAGFPTFTIPFADIDHLLDKQGEFWKSFH